MQKETELKPIIAMAVCENLSSDSCERIDEDNYRIDDKAYLCLTQLIADNLKVRRDQIVDFELGLCDYQPSQIMGLHNEFVSSPRLDNLASSMCALDGLIKQGKRSPAERNHAEIHMIFLFDHEEIGSTSAQGANCDITSEVIARVSEKYGAMTQEDHFRAKRNSIVLSADMAHAVHPNFVVKHQPQHQPHMHKGIVIKINAN